MSSNSDTKRANLKVVANSLQFWSMHCKPNQKYDFNGSEESYEDVKKQFSLLS